MMSIHTTAGSSPNLRPVGLTKLNSAPRGPLTLFKWCFKQKKLPKSKSFVSFWQLWCIMSAQKHSTLAGWNSLLFLNWLHTSKSQGRWPFVPKYKLWEQAAHTHRCGHTAWETRWHSKTKPHADDFKPWYTACAVWEWCQRSLAVLIIRLNPLGLGRRRRVFLWHYWGQYNKQEVRQRQNSQVTTRHPIHSSKSCFIPAFSNSGLINSKFPSIRMFQFWDPWSK